MKIILSILFVAGLWLSPKQDVLTLHFAGDSTMADKVYQPSNPEKGWAQVFRLYLKENVRVRNHAMNGRSTRNFQTECRWEQLLAELKPGDYVFI
jgi:lysophospholipase L1-like esterase